MEITPRKVLLHTALFLVTLVTTTMAGAEWVYAKSVFMPGYSWSDFASGFAYSVPFLLILTAHEFGHYFTAIHYRVRTTLPYYIPLPPLPLMFGTLGALIRLKSHVPSKQQNFDIGIAGPLAGFVVALVVLMYGFMTLPPPEYIYQFHPEYQTYGLDYAATVYQPGFMKEGMVDVILGKNLLFLFFEKVFGAGGRVPNAHELIHYPALFAGYLSLVFTSINLLPIGQLDGGHVLYGLIGFKRHRIIASVIFVAFLFYAGLGYIKFFGPQADPLWVMGAYFGFLYLCLLGLKLPWKDTLMFTTAIFTIQFLIGTWWPTITGYSGWLLFAFIIGRMIGVPHPPCEIEEPLSRTRIILGWIALIVFIICFVPAPLDLIVATPATP
ncbi:MAG TPA: site-2 protease family protein [Cyclobacteriaceae bacterium]|jgi:membrane-associated protease RseP (regulator of RpoE activity)|nr:site-2 protease family protein [Cyclobacteriaceae bacterium]